MKNISLTKKLFTVVFQCCDPPQPILIYNTNSESKHRHDPSFRYIHRTNGHIYGLEYNSEVIDEFNYMDVVAN